jgi:hypothetical protein
MARCIICGEEFKPNRKLGLNLTCILHKDVVVNKCNVCGKPIVKGTRVVVNGVPCCINRSCQASVITDEERRERNARIKRINRNGYDTKSVEPISI